MAEPDALNRLFGKGTVKLASLVLLVLLVIPPVQLMAPWEVQAQ